MLGVLGSSGRSRMKAMLLAGATLTGALLVGLAAAAPAKAITCIAQGEWTAIDASNSTKFAIAQNSQCQDMNAAYNYSHNDYIRGWYRDNSGTWHAGSRGYVWVTTCDCGWLVLLSNVANGTVVRGQGLNYAQYVEYVT